MAAGRHNLARQRGRGSLPVRPCNRNHRTWQKLRRKLDLPYHALAERARMHQRRRIHGNSRAHYDEILASKCAIAMSSSLDGDPVVEKNWDLIAQFITALCVGNSDLCPMRLHEKCRSNPGFPQADDQCAFSV